ncbi:MAG: PilX N-terminal domain-containing pilus assembly protein [Steroidobacteraceae bacterium]
MRPSSTAQRGVALITGLLLLLVMTLIAVAMFHGFGDQEQIAGNTREKQRALSSAVSAEQYAEWWLINGSVPPTSTCNSLVTAAVGQVCANALTNYATVPWTISGAQVGVSYTPFAQTQTITGPEGSSGTPGQGTYYGYPVFYITYLGSSASGQLYQVDAYGYGGTANALAEVESTYLVTSQYGETPLDIQK